jgi:hypothetical protein
VNDLWDHRGDALAAYKKAIDKAPSQPAVGEIEERVRVLTGAPR